MTKHLCAWTYCTSAIPEDREYCRTHGLRIRQATMLADYIRGHPGCWRKEIAVALHLSERQVQCYIQWLRAGYGPEFVETKTYRLQFVRSRGYRYVPDEEIEAGAARG